LKVIRRRLGVEPTGKAVCVSGLAVEARIARAAGFTVVVGAGDRERTAALAQAAAMDTDCLVSFGIAGGLAPELEAGTIVVSGQVVSEGYHWAIEPSARQQLSRFARSIGAVEGLVLGASTFLATQIEKKQAWAATDALSVDLESDIVARIATTLGIPFIVLRSIADTAQRDLPPAALFRLTTGGKPDFSSIVAAVLRRPVQLAGMIGLARETAIALAALIGPARALHSLVTTV